MFVLRLGLATLAFAIAVLLASCASPSERGPLGKADGFGSCRTEGGTACGGKSSGSCFCDDDCEAIGDCCEDKAEVCGCGPGGCAVRRYEVILNDPFCDVCSEADKQVLVARSAVVRRTVELIDGATASVDAAQFTFSQRPIGQALERAHARGVTVRLALDRGQDRPDSLGSALRAAGLEVRFVSGKPNADGSPGGLLHSKFLVVDGTTVMTGSNNWSSTGVSINEENNVVIHGGPDDELVAGYRCHFEALWAGQADQGPACSRGDVAFSPGGGGRAMIRDALRLASSSIDVLMHHLVFDDLVTELARAQERGVRVRVVINDEDRAEHSGARWDRLLAAGGELRLKRSNDALFQLQHNKLAIIDGRLLVNGSGNWSGSAFFNNHENFIRYDEPAVVDPFRAMFERLWMWSLRPASLDAGLDAAEQHVADTEVFLGNLHAHLATADGGRVLDDGNPRRVDAAGQPVDLGPAGPPGPAAEAAYRYARDQGRMDFLALSPHTTDEQPGDQAGQANMTSAGYEAVEAAAAAVTAASAGRFLALASMEWSTNALGNHVNVLGAGELCKVERGRFDRFYDEYLRGLRGAGQRPLVMMNHPKTFPSHGETLEGAWDQIFGVALTDIGKVGERQQKFNDYGLDDYAPLRDVLPAWLAGAAMPDPAVVDTTLANLWSSAAPYVRLIEVTVSRGNELSSEVAANPSLVPRDEAGGLERFTRVADWEYYLSRGFLLAPAASHDNHFANWGTGHSSRTGVIARALTARDLLDGIDQRQVFASEDQDLEVRFYVDQRVAMGGRAATTASELPARVHLSDPDFAGPYEVRVRRGRRGDAGFETVATVTAAAGWTDLSLPLPAAGEWIVYLEIVEPGPDRQAWTAPVWIERL
jgi:HKD family nuclease